MAMELPSMRSRCVTTFLLPLVLVLSAAAQAPTEITSNLPSPRSVPVHGHDSGDPEYGIWTAQPSYRASFHDGFTFYPRPTRSDEPSHHWQWRTQIANHGGVLAHTAWRVQIAHDFMHEVYDVRENGVEQSFVLATRPTEPGFHIRGRIATDLHAEPRAALHAPLTFTDTAGEAVVRYGEAFAIDANGDRIAVPSSYDGTSISLHVPDAWLAQACYPVTIDPLTSRAYVVKAATIFYEQYLDVHITRDSGTGQILVCYAYTFGGGDTDSYAWLCNADFSSPVLSCSPTSARCATRGPAGQPSFAGCSASSCSTSGRPYRAAPRRFRPATRTHRETRL